MKDELESLIKRAHVDIRSEIVGPLGSVPLARARGIWYETPEEVAAGLAWGKRKAVLLRRVRRYMRTSLSECERVCAELYFFGGKNCREIAEATGSTPPSVHRAVSRAARKLRKAAQRDKINRSRRR